MKYTPILLFAFFLVFNCTANGSAYNETNTVVTEEVDAPSRWQLRRNFYDKGEIIIVYDAEDKVVLSDYHTVLKGLTKESLGRRNTNINIKYRRSTDISEEEIKNSVLFLVGTAQANPLIKRLSTKLPVKFTSEGIRFKDHDFNGKDEVLSLSYFPNPENNQLPFLRITGNDDKLILQFLKNQFAKKRFLNQSMDLEIYRNDSKIVVGGFDRQWNLEKDAYFDFSYEAYNVLSTEHFEFISHDAQFEAPDSKELWLLMDASINKMKRFFGKSQSLSKVEVHLYKSAEEKGLLLGNTQQAHVDFENRTSHFIYNDKYANNFLQAENVLFSR
jgi:ribosomal protein S24E